MQDPLPASSVRARLCERSRHPSFDTVLIVLGVEVVGVGGVELTQPVSQDLDLLTRFHVQHCWARLRPGSAGGLWFLV